MSRGEWFEDLRVWQKSMALITQVCRLCQQCALSKDCRINDKMQRAAVSIAANICSRLRARKSQSFSTSRRAQWVNFDNHHIALAIRGWSVQKPFR